MSSAPPEHSDLTQLPSTPHVMFTNRVLFNLAICTRKICRSLSSLSPFVLFLCLDVSGGTPSRGLAPSNCVQTLCCLCDCFSRVLTSPTSHQDRVRGVNMGCCQSGLPAQENEIPPKSRRKRDVDSQALPADATQSPTAGETAGADILPGDVNTGPADVGQVADGEDRVCWRRVLDKPRYSHTVWHGRCA